MAQGFGASDPCQRHEAQKHQDAQDSVEPPRQAKMPANSAEQAVGIQRCKSGQHPAHGNINARLKAHDRAADPKGRLNSFLGTGTGHPHGRLSIHAAALSLGAGRLGFGHIGGQCRWRFGQGPACDGFTQGRVVDAGLSGHLGGIQSGIEQLLTSPKVGRSHHLFDWLAALNSAKR